jgi:glycosyltransferase involved in cell wall biosynthesis
MRILMLGWEYPPHISGGLGTACKGLTSAMDRLSARVLFILPRSVREDASAEGPPGDLRAQAGAPGHGGGRLVTRVPGGTQKLVEAPVPSEIVSPYQRFALAERMCESVGPPGDSKSEKARAAGLESRRARAPSSVRVRGAGTGDGYDGDLGKKIQDYAGRCASIARQELFDVIHAHDWMTFPAAMAIARLSGRPLVAHVHATEFDRAGENINRTIYEFERMGMHAANRVIAVSGRTRRLIVERYGVPPDKVGVVYNGVDGANSWSPWPRVGKEKVVLFLGRVTMQKGPEYFIRAAARTAEMIDDVRFVVAGAGDKLADVQRLASELGILHRVEFTGFLNGEDVDRMYSRADVYVMPSVSEPFGLTALEAASRGVPVIVSKSSGAAEVLVRGSLKVDFWDVDMMAGMIVDVLRRPGLAELLRNESRREIEKLSWDEAANKCLRFYYGVLGNAHTSGGFYPAAAV